MAAGGHKGSPQLASAKPPAQAAAAAGLQLSFGIVDGQQPKCAVQAYDKRTPFLYHCRVSPT